MAWGANDSNYPLEPLLNAALLAARREGDVEAIVALAEANHPGLRYWAAIGALARGGPDARWRPMLDRLLTDNTVSVRIAAAEALGRLSPADSARARNVLLASVSLREHGFGATVEALNALDGMGQATTAEMAILEKGLAGRDQVNQRIRDVPDRLMKSLAAKK
jgi:HEAT repeat protein